MFLSNNSFPGFGWGTNNNTGIVIPYINELDQMIKGDSFDENGLLLDKFGNYPAQLVEQPCTKLDTTKTCYAQFSKLGMIENSQSGDITLDTTYTQHLQSIAYDGTYVYWSFTNKLVKSQEDGTTVLAVDVPSHSGSICYNDNKIYVPLCVGGYGTGSVNTINVYQTSDLTLIDSHVITDDIEYGIGAIAYNSNNGHFYIGNAATCALNIDARVYEFDSSFNKINVFVVAEATPSYGIESLCLIKGMWYIAGYDFQAWFTEDLQTELYSNSIGGVYGLSPFGDYYITGKTAQVPVEWDGRYEIIDPIFSSTSTKYDNIDVTNEITGIIRFKGVHPLNIVGSYMRLLRVTSDAISLFYTTVGLNLKFTTTEGSSPRPFLDDSLIPDNGWVDFGFTYNTTDGKLKLFKDGLKVDEEQRDSTAIICNNIWTMGQTNQFEGMIGEARIYDKCFTDAEMLTAHNNGAVIHESNLKLWVVSPSKNGVCYDLSGNHHDGILVGHENLTSDEIDEVCGGIQDYIANYHAFGYTKNGDNYYPYDRLFQKCKNSESIDIDSNQGIAPIGGIEFNPDDTNPTPDKLRVYDRDNIIGQALQYWKPEIKDIASYDAGHPERHSLLEFTNGDYIRVFGTQLLIQRLFLKGYKTDDDWTAISNILNYSAVLDATQRQKVYNYLKDPSKENQEAWELYQDSSVVAAFRFDQALSVHNENGELCKLGWEATAQDITAFADYSATVAGTVRATLVGHGYVTGDKIKQYDGSVGDYDGTHLITRIDNDYYYFTETWVGTETSKAVEVGDTVAKVLDVGSGGADGVTYYNLTQADLSLQFIRIPGGIDSVDDTHEMAVSATLNGKTATVTAMDGTTTATFVIASAKITGANINGAIGSYECKSITVVA